jgi:hypothetical protein
MSERTKALAEQTIRDIAKRRETAEKEVFGYFKEQSIKKKKNWNFRVGGYRW